MTAWKWIRHGGNGYLVPQEFNEETDYVWDSVIIDDGSADGEYSPRIDVGGPHARLIAAAPELLEACKKMAAMTVCPGCGGTMGHYNPCPVRDAIAKAEGTSPGRANQSSEPTQPTEAK